MPGAHFMRFLPLFLLLLIGSLSAEAQRESLPDILRPDDAAQLEARRQKAAAVKLLPLGTYPDKIGTFTDSENPIGIRGGGSYFSFSTGSHSLNSVPELEFDSGMLVAWGTGFGFLADLGLRDLDSVTTSTAEAQFVISYDPPKFAKDVEAAEKSIEGVRIGNLILSEHPKIQIGHCYLLRSVTWDRADLAVAIEIIRQDADGAITILWKTLAELPKRPLLYMADEELANRVNAIIDEAQILCDRVVVKENHLYFLVDDRVGPRGDGDRRLEAELKHRKVQYRGSGGILPQ